MAQDPKSAASTAGKKRSAAASGLDQRPHRPVKRRASKACQCCRSRKVRCNVVEHGAPCTNCRLDQVECIIMESKRRRKSISRLDPEPVAFGSGKDDVASPSKPQQPQAQHHQPATAPHWSNSISASAPPARPILNSSADSHVPHPLYRSHEHQSPPAEPQPHLSRPSFSSSLGDEFLPNWNRFPLLAGLSTPQVGAPFTPPAQQPPMLPGFVRPLPQRMDPIDAAFLQNKGAFDLPSTELRNALLEAYLEFVDPTMPVLEMNEFLSIIECADGAFGKVSMLVLQAVMFAGSTFVDLALLRRSGFQSRQQARKNFYQKARLLYDFDYDTDRVSLLQAALLMSYWYETPDDQKDTWYWMGIAITVASSIGLNRDPAQSNLDPARQKLWKRMWWAAVIRDSLIAIGMRRPLRIKTEEHDVPMVDLTDFTLSPVSSDITSISNSCLAARDSDMRKKLALIFIEQAKLCTCIGHVISTQYALPSSSVSQEGKMALARLLPKKDAEDTRKCADELDMWMSCLSDEVQFLDHGPYIPSRSYAPFYLNRALVHMEYYMALSALHRPQAMSGIPAPRLEPGSKSPAAQVRHAAFQITDIAQTLHQNNFSRFLPTTGITVLQPALISHLLDVRSTDSEVRENALRGFCQCFQVLSRLRDNYPGAEYSIAILDAGVRRAELEPSTWPNYPETHHAQAGKITSAEALVEAGLRMRVVPLPPHMEHSPTPTENGPDSPVEALFSTNSLPFASGDLDNAHHGADDVLARRLGMFLATTPPASDDSSGMTARDLDREFESLINVDDLGEALNMGDGALTSMQGEASGFMLDMEFAPTAPMSPEPTADADFGGGDTHELAGDAAAAETLATPDEEPGKPSDELRLNDVSDLRSPKQSFFDDDDDDNNENATELPLEARALATA